VGQLRGYRSQGLERQFPGQHHGAAAAGAATRAGNGAGGQGAIVVTGNTSALRGRANFAGFAPTKAAQRILAEAMARDLGPKGVHVPMSSSTR